MSGKKKTYRIIYLIILCCAVLFSVGACSAFKKTKKEAPDIPPEESLREANELIKDRYYEEAREILESVTTRDATLKYSVLARLRIADTYYEEEAYEEAVVEYESFLNLYPYHKYASYAQFKLAMSYYKRIKTVDISYSWAQRALFEFKKLQRKYPRNPYMNIIDNRIKASRNILAEYEFYVGNFYFKKGSYKAAAGRFSGMLQDYPESSKVPDALYYAGLSYENLGQRDEAMHMLSVLIRRYPTIEISVEAKKLMDSFN